MLDSTPGVEFVEEDAPLHATPTQYEEDPGDKGTELPWGLDRIDSKLGMDGLYALGGPNAGRGVHIYVLDTGIKTTHAEFGGRAVPTLDSTSLTVKVCGPNDANCAVDLQGHGTHAAATIGGHSVGVASGSWLHAVKILNDRGHGSYSSLLSAIDFILANGEKPAVIFGALQAPSGLMDSRILKMALNKTNTSNIPLIFAGGDLNKDACESMPANMPVAFTVVASNIGDQRAKTSNHGKCADLFAPGVNIRTAGIESDSTYALVSGTSLAAAHVAGAAAMLLSQGANRTSEVYKYLTESAEKGIMGELTVGSPNRLLSLDFADLYTKTVVIGRSTFTDGDPRKDKGRKKCIETKPAVTCAANAGDPGMRVGDDEFRAQFQITSERDGELICAQRRDTVDDDFLPGKDQKVGNGNGDSGKWNVNLAIRCPVRAFTAPPDKWLFQRVVPNADALCAGEHTTDRKSIYFASYENISTYKRCEELCVSTKGCTGYSYTQRQCEVWLAKINSYLSLGTSASDNGGKDAICMKLAARGVAGSGTLRVNQDPSMCIEANGTEVGIGDCAENKEGQQFVWTGVGHIKTTIHGHTTCLEASNTSDRSHLQAANCSSESGDQIFGFQGSGVIRTPEGRCLYASSANGGASLMLATCDDANPSMQFFY